MYPEEKLFNFNLTDKTVPEIPKSVELISSVTKNNNKDDFLHPATAANANLVYNSYTKNTDDLTPFEEERTEPHTTNTRTCINKNKSGNIHDWDDILDFESFVSNMIANEEVNKDTSADKTFDSTLSNKNIAITEPKSNGNKNNIAKGDKCKDINESKAKNVKTDSNVGKSKQKIQQSDKTINKKNYYRKQNYTKAVKNWLNNVAHHPVDKVLSNVVSTNNIEQGDKVKSDAENIDQNIPLNKTPMSICGNIVIDKKLKTTKKVIQAQLANKDGVMKFSKPNRNGEEQTNKPKDSKDKKVKKFVAPIKSQIPVKEVMYEILMIDENNIENYRECLYEIRNSEIIAVLIYR